MAWVAVDKDGRECIYQFHPKRDCRYDSRRDKSIYTSYAG